MNKGTTFLGKGLLIAAMVLLIDQGFGANQWRRCSGVVQAFQTSSTGTSTSLSRTRSSFGLILITDEVTSRSPVSSS